jgi:hypothetical protein
VRLRTAGIDERRDPPECLLERFAVDGLATLIFLQLRQETHEYLGQESDPRVQDLGDLPVGPARLPLLTSPLEETLLLVTPVMLAGAGIMEVPEGIQGQI